MALTKVQERQSFKGPENWFTGHVRVEMLFTPQAKARTSAGSVTFEPEARTAWHSHPIGQSLIVTAGVGYVQFWGEERQEIVSGDVVWIPAGVKHWHGASEKMAMTHIAVQEEENGSAADWMELVSDAQYAGI
ncbi:(R)-mandelonitrile lyase [Tolumonas lignilytica]|uniref:(R)-mandelonitrile lyase n=1 Tax=Tolumonas lignilytica TaxID=1283284 RepID=UPI0004672A1E|nr:cupin domain-containing protein [Tolumonas lignilytica]